jgi:transcriptional regulator with XRE-family HTH domain
MESLADRIKKMRKKEEISAEKLAKKIGVSKENIYKWEGGSKPSDPEAFARLTAWLNSSENSTNLSERPSAGYVPTERLIEVLERDAERYYNLAMAQLTGIDKKLEGINSNLTDALGGVFQQSLKMEAVSTVALKALSEIQGKKPDALQKEADKRQREKLDELTKTQGKQVGADN